MSSTFIQLTNRVLNRFNEVELTTSNFASARGIHKDAQNAVLDAVDYINNRDFNWPFNFSANTDVLTAGIGKYSADSGSKIIDFETFRIVEGDSPSVQGRHLKPMDYYQFVERYIDEQEEVEQTALNGSITDSDATITVDSTSGFDSAGSIVIEDETITYTGVTSTTFTGCTRGANGTTAASHADNATVTQFSGGGVPQYVIAMPDQGYSLYPYPDKRYTVKYDDYTQPTRMSAHGDTTTVPTRHDSAIIEGAVSYLYRYRGEIELYRASWGQFNEQIDNMEVLLKGRTVKVYSGYIPKGGSYRGTINARVG